MGLEVPKSQVFVGKCFEMRLLNLQSKRMGKNELEGDSHVSFDCL